MERNDVRSDVSKLSSLLFFPAGEKNIRENTYSRDIWKKCLKISIPVSRSSKLRLMNESEVGDDGSDEEETDGQLLTSPKNSIASDASSASIIFSTEIIF